MFGGFTLLLLAYLSISGSRWPPTVGWPLVAVAATDSAAVIMDCEMPEMDGYEPTVAIRRAEGARRVPIIAMTASAMRSAHDKCRASGMEAYLSKPFRREELATTLRKWVGPEERQRLSQNGHSPLVASTMAQLRDLEIRSGLDW